MNLNCVITDDEPVAIEIMEDYIRMVPGLNLVAKCKNAMETFEILRRSDIDILFIDIEMPEITGVDFIRSLKNKPAVVFTTAFPNYAVNGFELDAVDYLLKPISIDRFLRAVDKICNRHDTLKKNSDPSMQDPAVKKFFFIKSNQEFLKVEVDKILFIEGMENYVKIHFSNKHIVVFITMKYMEDILAPYNFLRIHRSFIVNLGHVDRVQNNVFCIGEKKLVTGKSYKTTVSRVLKAFYSI